MGKTRPWLKRGLRIVRIRKKMDTRIRSVSLFFFKNKSRKTRKTDFFPKKYGNGLKAKKNWQIRKINKKADFSY
jgi:hypothetical protein